MALVGCFWYGFIPVVGAFLVRAYWRALRRRFDELRRAPILDYRAGSGATAPEGAFRFFGVLEAAEPSRLWVRGADLSAAVELQDSPVWLIPPEDEGGGSLRRLGPRELEALGDGLNVFVGGRLLNCGGVLRFSVRAGQKPLAILYDGAPRSLLPRLIAAARQGNEYWNDFTPLALALGAFSECLAALAYSGRPAHEASVSAALAAAALPLVPLVPPGVLFLAAYKRAWAAARRCRVLRDLARSPLVHAGGDGRGCLPDGQAYGRILLDEEARSALENGPPPLAGAGRPLPGRFWRCWGGIDDEGRLREPADPTAAYLALGDDCAALARRFSLKARVREAAAAALLASGAAANMLFVYLVIETARRSLR